MNRNTINLIFFIITLNFSFSQDNKIEKFKGFFDFTYNQSKDKIFLHVDKLDYEFLYIGSLASGVGSNDIGLDRGQLGSERLVKFVKKGNKLLLIEPNLYYRAETENKSEKKSVEQAFAKSVIFGFEIIESKEDSYLIDITPFLMYDRHGVAKRLRDSKQGSYKVDKSKSAIEIENTKAFPENVEFEALLTFSGEAKGNLIRSVAPDPDNVTVFQHHSFIKLPDNNYKPRKFDARSGAISISYMDYSTPITESITKKYIIRHRLEKKNPELDISEAVEPIIYYLDPGTPEPVKSALLDGGRWWNQAYESIGFKDAFQVKMLPEGVDPLDCRYNVIQWVHRSTRGWSYGASVVDPRTGEIIKGHVSLGSLRIRQDYMIAQALTRDPFISEENNNKMLELAISRIRQLSAHEIGHTIGFAHNFAASTNNRASVMDYPHPLVDIKDDEIVFDDAYDTGIGEWDKVTVAYSYSDFKIDEDEGYELNKILENSTKDGLRFITDYDARSVDGSHAYAHLWDNGDTAYSGLDKVIEIRKKAIQNFSENNAKKGTPNSVLEDIFVPLYFFHRYQTEATAKIIGGMDYNYSLVGDNQNEFHYLDKDTQLEALNSLIKTLSPSFLAIPKDKLKLFPPRAFGYPRTRESFQSNLGVAFDPFSVSETSADMTLSLILRPKRLNRLILQHSLNNSNLSLDDLYNFILKRTILLKTNNLPSIDDSYYEEVQHIVNVTLLKNLFKVINDSSTFSQVKNISNDYLTNITLELLSKKRKDYKLSKYSSYYIRMIKDFYEDPEEYKIKESLKIPDGSPIGTDNCNYISVK
ncbi:MAG: zinc-dependent metalloprotease [Flavobacteriaceae bacterium]